nr:hypothetical protein [Tanacetum cinerariifolium]
MDAKSAMIRKNGLDYDITVAKSSHDKDKTTVQWLNNDLFQNDFYHNHEVEKRNEDNKVLKEANDLLTKELKMYKERLQILVNKPVNNTVLKKDYDELQTQFLVEKQKIKDLEKEKHELATQISTQKRDNIRKSSLGYKGPCVLSQSNAKNPKLYSTYELRDKNVQLHVFDSDETLEDVEKSRLKMKEFQKDEKVQELKIKSTYYTKLNNFYETFVPQVELSL